MTAHNVPACAATSKASPRSLDPKIKDGNKRWAELDTGKNSVNP